MSNFYGIYSSCRDAAWRCQIDFNVIRLPVKVISIARCVGIRVVKNSVVDELRCGEMGVSITDGKHWTIVYDDSLSNCEARMVVAHELGHIFLGHDYKYLIRRFKFSSEEDRKRKKGAKLSYEREADMFAMRLLAPAFVFHELNITDDKTISELCDIPVKAAKVRAKRFEILEKRSHFYTSELERELYERFEPWIRYERLMLLADEQYPNDVY